MEYTTLMTALSGRQVRQSDRRVLESAGADRGERLVLCPRLHDSGAAVDAAGSDASQTRSQSFMPGLQNQLRADGVLWLDGLAPIEGMMIRDDFQRTQCLMEDRTRSR